MSRKFTWAAVLLATTAPFTGAALAQEVSDEIVITAQKREESLQEVPISVAVISAETLEQVGADGLEDVSRMVPSLAMTNLSRGGNQVQIRGLGSNVGNVGTVAIYNDGVIGVNRIQSSGTFSEQDSALFDVERVEVLRGPQGTLYGEGSFGGVINIISRRPDLEQFQAAFGGAWADTEHGSESTRVQGMINIPIARNQLGLRVVAYEDDQGGYIDSIGSGFVVEPFGSFVAEDVNWTNVTGGRAILTAQPTNTFDVSLIFKTEEIEVGGMSISSPNVVDLVNGLAMTNYDRDYTQMDYFASSSVANTDQLILELNAEIGGASFTFISGYGEQESSNSGGALYQSQAWSHEARLSSNNDGVFNWTLGAYQRSAERDIDYLGTPLQEDTLDAWAVFGQAYWEFMPNVTATLGLRYESQDSEVNDQLNGLLSDGSADSIVPKVAIAWQPDEDSLYYVSAARGVRAGGANVDVSLGTDMSFVQAFDPDSIWNYEVGLKRTFAEGRATFNAAIFYVDWTDVQIDQPIDSLINPPIAFIVVNGKDAHSLGIEAELLLHPTSQWDISLGGSLIEAEFDNGTIFDDGLMALVPLKGQRLASSPRYVVNASVERRFDFTTSLEGYVRADYSLRGSSFGDVPNEAPPGGNFASGESQLVNLRFGLRQENWDFQIFADNVFDTAASTFNFFDGGFVDQNVVLRPRTIGAQVRVRYN